RTVLLSGFPSHAPYDITHLGSEGLQLTYSDTTIDLLNADCRCNAGVCECVRVAPSISSFTVSIR
ncbi:hypothetical protein, partial [Acinetobacter baumannii]|uniref:hypothetical protein n=1 Tax=Acinetobacter baumannii TaxID=470 RepID=UPI001BB4653F